MSEYDARADVYFHEGTASPPPYFVSFEPDGPGDLFEAVETQLGPDYERLVDPGEKVYVGYIKYHSDGSYNSWRDNETDDWAFNRVPPEYVDAEPDGETYMEETTEPVEDDHDPGQVAFYVYGIDPPEIDHAWQHGEGDSNDGFDHEAHEAATICMNALKERFDWAETIEGVSMGTRE